jgi:hypothetical protein
VFGGGSQQGFQIFGCEDGVVIHHEEMGKFRELFDGELAGSGEAATKAEILAGGDELARQGGFFDYLDRGGVGAVVADHGGERTDRLAAERFEKTGEKVCAEAGGHEGDDARRLSHDSRMDDLR